MPTGTSELMAISVATGHVTSTMTRTRAAVDGLSDEAMLAGLAVGDTDMGVAFVRRFQRRVYGVALSVVSDPGLAEDVAQEALLRAWRHAAVFDPRRGTVATWLLSITRNLAIDALRMRRARPSDPSVLMELLADTGARGPEDAAVAADSAHRLRTALGDLPAEQRRALALACYSGRTAQEIAVSEGIPLGTAKTRIRSAMGKLRVALVEERGTP